MCFSFPKLGSPGPQRSPISSQAEPRGCRRSSGQNHATLQIRGVGPLWFPASASLPQTLPSQLPAPVENSSHFRPSPAATIPSACFAEKTGVSLRKQPHPCDDRAPCPALITLPSFSFYDKKTEASPSKVHFSTDALDSISFFSVEGGGISILDLSHSASVFSLPRLVPPHCTSMLKPFLLGKKKAIQPWPSPSSSSSQPACLNCPCPCCSVLTLPRPDIWLCCLWM